MRYTRRMNSQPIILAIRAIGAELARRTFVPVATVLLIIGGLATIGGWYLTTLSPWWWILCVVLLIALCVMIGVLFVVYNVIRYVRPEQTKQQKQQAKEFVDIAQEASEVAGTPKFILLFRVVRDIAQPSNSTYVRTLTTQTASLKSRFQEITKSYTK